MRPSKTTRATGGAAKPMTGPDASRIQSSQAKAGNNVGKDSFPARAQASAAKTTTTPPLAKGKSGKSA